MENDEEEKIRDEGLMQEDVQKYLSQIEEVKEAGLDESFKTCIGDET